MAVPAAVNEPVRSYAPGTPERADLEARLDSMAKERIEIPVVIEIEHDGRSAGPRGPDRDAPVTRVGLAALLGRARVIRRQRRRLAATLAPPRGSSG